MLCIIAGHFGIATADHFVYTFHVPLFFLLSGYFFSTKASFPSFMKQKARQLLLPYYVTGIAILITATVVNHFVWPESQRFTKRQEHSRGFAVWRRNAPYRPLRNKADWSAMVPLGLILLNGLYASST